MYEVRVDNRIYAYSTVVAMDVIDGCGVIKIILKMAQKRRHLRRSLYSSSSLVPDDAFNAAC